MKGDRDAIMVAMGENDRRIRRPRDLGPLPASVEPSAWLELRRRVTQPEDLDPVVGNDVHAAVVHDRCRC